MEVEEEEIEEIENKIEVLSLEEKPKYKLNKSTGENIRIY